MEEKVTKGEEEFQEKLKLASARAESLKKYCSLISDQDTIDLLQTAANDINAFISLIKVYDKNLTKYYQYTADRNKTIRDILFKLAIYEQLLDQDVIDAVKLLAEKRMDCCED